jgi:hypothetical protein
VATFDLNSFLVGAAVGACLMSCVLMWAICRRTRHDYTPAPPERRMRW